jgi:hypothetical protein
MYYETSKLAKISNLGDSFGFSVVLRNVTQPDEFLANLEMLFKHFKKCRFDDFKVGYESMCNYSGIKPLKCIDQIWSVLSQTKSFDISYFGWQEHFIALFETLRWSNHYTTIDLSHSKLNDTHLDHLCKFSGKISSRYKIQLWKFYCNTVHRFWG